MRHEELKDFQGEAEVSRVCSLQPPESLGFQPCNLGPLLKDKALGTITAQTVLKEQSFPFNCGVIHP